MYLSPCSTALDAHQITEIVNLGYHSIFDPSSAFVEEVLLGFRERYDSLGHALNVSQSMIGWKQYEVGAPSYMVPQLEVGRLSLITSLRQRIY